MNAGARHEEARALRATRMEITDLVGRYPQVSERSAAKEKGRPIETPSKYYFDGNPGAALPYSNPRSKYDL
jgi:hypothetical protein